MTFKQNHFADILLITFEIIQTLLPYYFDDDDTDRKKLQEQIDLLSDQLDRIPYNAGEQGQLYYSPDFVTFPTIQSGGSSGTVSENTEIKDYGDVSGIVTIDQSFKSHRMTLSGDITVAFDGKADAQHLTELVFVIVQKKGNKFKVAWPDSVKTIKSIKIKDSSESDVENHLVGFTVDGGVTYQISNVGERRIISGGAIVDGSIPASKIDGFAQETLNEINKWLDENAGLKYFSDNFESVKSNLDTAYGWVNGASQNVKDIINDAVSEIEAALGQTYSDMKDWYENASANIDSAINSALSSGGAILEQIADSLSGYATQTWVNAQSFVSDIVSEISSNASSVINALKPSLDGIYQTISGLTSQIISEINTALESGSEIFNSIVSSVSATVSDIVGLVSANASDVADALRSSLDSVYVNVNDFTSDVKSVISSSISNIEAALGDTYTNMKNWYSGLSSSVRNAIDDAVNWFNGLSSSVRNGISSAVSWYDSASSNVKNIIKSSTAEIEQGLGSAYTNLKNWYESINSKTRDALEDIGSSITSFIYGDDSASSQRGSNGDIDARTHDLVNVDRIFFNSNDSLKTDSVYPHITGADILNNRNMFLYAPSAFLFYTGTENNFAIDSSFTYIYNKLNARDDIIASNHIDLFKTFKIKESIQAGYTPSGESNKAILFCRPSSSGKLELRCKFASGTSQLIAVEP